MFISTLDPQKQEAQLHERPHEEGHQGQWGGIEEGEESIPRDFTGAFVKRNG